MRGVIAVARPRGTGTRFQTLGGRWRQNALISFCDFRFSVATVVRREARAPRHGTQGIPLDA